MRALVVRVRDEGVVIAYMIVVAGKGRCYKGGG